MNAVTKQEQTALSLPERAAVALGAAEHEIKLRELVKSSADIIAVIDPAGRDQAHRIGMTLKTARVSIEKTGKAAREDATAFSKAVIAEEKRLLGLIVPEEERVLSLRDQFDAAEQRRKDALIAAERARTDAIQASIQAIRDIPLAMIGKPAQDISRCIAGLVGTVPDESFEEFIEQAKVARYETLDKLAAAETAQRAIEIEAESQRQEAARQALAAEEARKAESDRVEAERQELAKLRADAERVANEQAKERQRLADLAAAQEAEARRISEKAAANLKAEQDALAEQVRLQREASAEAQRKLDAQQAEIDAKRAAFVREQEEAAARVEDAIKMEADHADALLMDGEFNSERVAQLDRDYYDTAYKMNAQFDIDAAAQLARCTETAKAMLTQGRSLVLPESYCERDALADAGFDETPTDGEILDVYVENFGGTREQAIERLALFDAVAARADAEVMA